MTREKPHLWRCEHLSPIEVVPLEVGKRARCLVCGTYGPPRASTEAALRALRAEATYRNEVHAQNH
jgi:hypothetical protein